MKVLFYVVVLVETTDERTDHFRSPDHLLDAYSNEVAPALGELLANELGARDDVLMAQPVLAQADSIWRRSFPTFEDQRQADRRLLRRPSRKPNG